MLRRHGVRLRTVHQLQVLDDGTAIALYELAGDTDGLGDPIDGEEVRDYTRFTGTDGPLLWLHWRPGPLLAELFDAYRDLPGLVGLPARTRVRGRLDAAPGHDGRHDA